ncbi:MAG: hypothetical protein ACRDCB_09935 [Clostridium sp.]
MNKSEFLKRSKEYKLHDDWFLRYSDSKKEISNKFLVEDIKNLTVDKYILSKTNYPKEYKNTFTYALQYSRKENIIKLGSASKFHIYMNKEGEYCCGYLGKKKKLLQNELDVEFNYLKNKIINYIKASKENNPEKFLNFPKDIQERVLIVILQIYTPEKVLDIVEHDILVDAARTLDININNISNRVYINYVVTRELKSLSQFKGWDISKLSGFIYKTFKNKKEADLRKE